MNVSEADMVQLYADMVLEYAEEMFRLSDELDGALTELALLQRELVE